MANDVYQAQAALHKRLAPDSWLRGLSVQNGHILVYVCSRKGRPSNIPARFQGFEVEVVFCERANDARKEAWRAATASARAAEKIEEANRLGVPVPRHDK